MIGIHRYKIAYIRNLDILTCIVYGYRNPFIFKFELF